MGKSGLRAKDNNLFKYTDALVKRANSLQGYFDSVVFRQYQAAQIQRWKTQNASEGEKWDDLNPLYAKRKLTRFASYPGGGHVMMIATSKVMRAATGQDASGFTKVATNKGLTVQINTSAIPYASYPAEKRPYMEFGTATLTKMRSALTKYMGSI